MNTLKRSAIFFLLTLTMNHAHSEEIDLAIDEKLFIHLQPEDSFSDVIKMIGSHLAEGQLASSDTRSFRMDLAVSANTIHAKATTNPQAVPRDYSAMPSSKEKEDIRFILKTLANNSLIKIGTNESQLKKAGERIDRVHPLKFLEFVFTDEELKVCMHNIQGRSWVWKEFISGITGSLGEEFALGNLKSDFINQFSKSINLNVNLINPSIQGQRWNEFIDILIAKVPREKGSDRYNM